MPNSASTIVAWIRHRRWLMHGFIVSVFAILFLLPYFITAARGIPYSLSTILDPFLIVDFGVADTVASHGTGTPVTPDIVFLGIDDASTRLDSLSPDVIKGNRVLTLMTNRWPWPREIYAALLDRLCDSGAKVVIFDILFGATTPDDPLLKASLNRHADKVIIGCNFSDSGDRLALPSESLIPFALPLDSRVGFVNFWTDRDGVIRRAKFHQRYNGAAIGLAESPYEVDSIAVKAMQIMGKGNMVPAGDGKQLFRYTSERGSLQPISVYQVFDPDAWSHNFGSGAFFKNKIVMIGPSGNFQQDEHVTPLGSMDGAEIHLQALNALLHHEFLFYTGDSLAWTILLVCLTGFTAWILLVTVYRASTFCFSAIAFYAAYSLLTFPFYSHGIILSVAAPVGTFFMSTLIGLSTQYLLEQLERARTRRFFERYVSPNVVGEILDNPVLYNESLVGRRREVTILFSDLRGFTAMTERADSEQLVRELNEYLEEMTKALFEHKGILDKFIGDAVMAVWGSFTPDPEIDTQNAVKAALGMSRALAALNIRRVERGLARLGMGVGIHHGEAIVGDIGSERARNFTVIGDTVNLASRLEGVTKEYGVELVISETVERLVRPYFHLQSLGFEVVKGRQKPVGIFTVLGSKEEPLSAMRAAYLEQFEKAMKAYFNRDFAKARQGLAACIKLVGEDSISSVFIERCLEYQESPPPKDWDGAHRMTRK